MSLKKIILIGSVATVGLGIAGTTYVVKKIRAKRESLQIPEDFEETLLKQLNDFVGKLGDSDEADTETDAESAENKPEEDIEIRLDEDFDSDADSDSNASDDDVIVELNNFQANLLGIADKPLGSAVSILNHVYIFVNAYTVNDDVVRVYKLSQHQGRKV